MLDKFSKIPYGFLGLELDTLTIWHMTLRTLVVLIFGFIIARMSKRLIQKRSIFDFLLNIIMGSMLASGIVGARPFLPTIGTVFLITFINLGLNILMFKFPSLERFIQGKPIILITEGKLNEKNIKKYFVTKTALQKALYLAQLTDIKEVSKAYLDNTGEIIVLKQDPKVKSHI